MWVEKNELKKEGSLFFGVPGSSGSLLFRVLHPHKKAIVTDITSITKEIWYVYIFSVMEKIQEKKDTKRKK